MIDLYYWTTPNGHKLTMFLEESGLAHRLVPVNLQKQEQFQSEFLRVSPNNKIPAIADNSPAGGGAPITIFESGAILLYLAEKCGKLIPQDLRGRSEVRQWLFWQVAGMSPMSGQNIFFRHASEQLPFAIDRFTKETARLFGVLNDRLADRPFVGGNEYSIADISAYPWAVTYPALGIDLDQFPHLERWMDSITLRPSTVRAFATAKKVNPDAPPAPAPRKGKA